LFVYKKETDIALRFVLTMKNNPSRVICRRAINEKAAMNVNGKNAFRINCPFVPPPEIYITWESKLDLPEFQLDVSLI